MILYTVALMSTLWDGYCVLLSSLGEQFIMPIVHRVGFQLQFSKPTST